MIVLSGKKENISVGLTSNNTRGDLLPVKYSNGSSGYMKRTASREYANAYDNKIENFTVDIDNEKIAYRIAMNKLLNDIGKNRKVKKRNKK